MIKHVIWLFLKRKKKKKNTEKSGKVFPLHLLSSTAATVPLASRTTSANTQSKPRKNISQANTCFRHLSFVYVPAILPGFLIRWVQLINYFTPWSLLSWGMPHCLTPYHKCCEIIIPILLRLSAGRSMRRPPSSPRGCTVLGGSSQQSRHCSKKWRTEDLALSSYTWDKQTVNNFINNH